MLLSDEKKVAIKAYGVDGPLGIGVRRATFLIGPDRRVQMRCWPTCASAAHQAFVQKAIAARENRSA